MYQFLLYNTKDKKYDWLKTMCLGRISLYTCGPTVYSYAHVGNLRTYIFEDILKKGLNFFGYNVYHVLNITDVGHLESDHDWGNDKLSTAAYKEHRTVFEIANYYECKFFNDIDELSISESNITCRATWYIDQMIEHIWNLIRLGYAYVSNNNIYFKINKYEEYYNLIGKKSNFHLSRIEIDKFKLYNTDFVLWFSQSKFPKQIMKWESPWGIGFPGWHIECSVMALYNIGRRLDIHCGGIDHITIHHTNEKAQSESLLQHVWVNNWLHGNFLIFNNIKMSKSLKNVYTLENLKKEGFEPIHFRFFCLGVHYRDSLNFSLSALNSAKDAYDKLLLNFKNLQKNHKDTYIQGKKLKNDRKCKLFLKKIENAILFDLDTPKIIDLMWKILQCDELNNEEKIDLLLLCDSILGLNFIEIKNLSKLQIEKIQQRDVARQSKNWALADEIRKELELDGIYLNDKQQNTEWYFKSGKRDLNPRL